MVEAEMLIPTLLLRPQLPLLLKACAREEEGEGEGVRE